MKRVILTRIAASEESGALRLNGIDGFEVGGPPTVGRSYVVVSTVPLKHGAAGRALTTSVVEGVVEAGENRMVFKTMNSTYEVTW